MTTRRTTSVERRFWAKVALPRSGTGCMVWLGHIRPNGYGTFSDQNRKTVYPHRFAYMITGGPIPGGFQIDHLCRNTQCVRPDHLEAVPPNVNNSRSDSPSALNARKTECTNGHAFDHANTYVDPLGKRHCRECTNANGRKYRAARRG